MQTVSGIAYEKNGLNCSPCSRSQIISRCSHLFYLFFAVKQYYLIVKSTKLVYSFNLQLFESVGGLCFIKFKKPQL